LRIRIIRGVSAIEPYDVNPAIWSHRKSTKPMPFGRIHRIIIDSDRGAKSVPAIGDPNKHDIRRTARTYNTRQHINIVVSAGSGAINR
jgi:hypothetical protein